MYCVKCGVKLQKGETECPLCHTQVVRDEIDEDRFLVKYSDRYPSEKDHGKYVAIGIATVLMIAAVLITMIVCLNSYGELAWGGYVMLGVALLWIVLVFPWIFNRFNSLVFVPVDFAFLLGYLLYICLKTGGKWFLSFAFPVVGLICALTMFSIVFFRYIKKGRLFFTGGMMMAIGSSMMLVEFLSSITFNKPMFVWSLYCVILFGLIGLFLLIAAIIPPLRDFLERKFFF